MQRYSQIKACVAITSYFGRNIKKLFFLEKKIASFWVANRTVIIKLLNDHIYSITHDVDVLALS